MFVPAPRAVYGAAVPLGNGNDACEQVLLALGDHLVVADARGAVLPDPSTRIVSTTQRKWHPVRGDCDAETRRGNGSVPWDRVLSQCGSRLPQ